MKPLEDIDPRDLGLFTGPEKDALVVDGPAVFDSIFSLPTAPRLDAASWYVARAVNFSNGARHAALRQRMSDLLTAKYDVLDSDRELAFEGRSAVVEGPMMNLVEDICVPTTNQVIATYLVVPDDVMPFLNSFNAIRFHRDLRIGQVIKLDKVVASIRDATLACPERADFVELIPTMLITRHTLIATFALSLADVLAKVPGGELAELKLPTSLSVTSLPYLARVAPESIQGHARCYHAGQAYRCPVSTRLKDTGEFEVPSFGERPRACLGRTMSFIVWRRMSEALNRILQLRLDQGQSRFDLINAVNIPEVGDHPVGGDLRFQ